MAEEPGQIREAIAQDREDLATTVQALAEKADVKARVKETVADSAQRVKEVTPSDAAEEVRRRPVPYAVAAVVVLGLLIMRRRRRRDG